MESPLNKSELRWILKKRRSELNEKRRNNAKLSLTTTLLPLLSSYKKVLSFASFSTEIDTSLLNHLLSIQGKLYLPKLNGKNIEVYQVENLQTLVANSWRILEPCMEISKKTSLNDIDIILVPGLGFDTKKHRIGYGKGIYDRLLLEASHTKKLGIGFKEQFVFQLPIEDTDQLLSEVILF